ncbi:hypothetical protein EWH91_06815 [Sporolactobacillus sp. THM19-2]|nr:hypothetical protein EWH91_06815 [Sporolactobacillus sp. THM19-2]
MRLKRLEQRGYIKKENRVDEKGAHLSNIYHLFDIASDTLPVSRSINESPAEQPLPESQSMNDLPVALSLPEGQPINDPPVRQSLIPKNKDLEEYKVKNKKEYRRIIDYLNQKADKTYKASTRKTQSLIHARLSEGFCFDDFKSVIDKKCKQWLNDPKMSRYVRPATLFGTKFEDYLNEPEMYDGSATFTHDLAERWLRRDDENGSLSTRDQY